jgi:uncharacterized protein YjbI with pentapeptide repeats
MTEDLQPNLLNSDQTGKDLSHANLRAKNLRLSDFTRARLVGAKLQEAQLYQTKFRFADLSYVEFCDSSGTAESIASSQAKDLLPSSLAGANLEGAILPEKIANFPQLNNIEEASKSGTTTLFAMLVACLFCLLTSGTFSDAALITNSGSTSAIPGVGLTLPVRPFLFAAPFLLLAFQLYFTLNLQRYEELIADLPSVFPDGTPLYLKIYPWLFSSLIPIVRFKQSGPKPTLAIFEAPLAIVLAYVLVPGSIWVVWFRALGGHSVSAYTTLFALGVSIAVSFVQFAVGRATLREGRLAPWRAKSVFPWWLIVLTLIAAMMFCIGTAITIQASRGAIVAPPEYVSLEEPPSKESLWRNLLFSVGYFETAGVSGEDVSKKPASWTGKETSGEPELKAVIGAKLDFQNLRFLRAFKAFLVNSQMSSADLTGAVLAYSDLRGADLTDARLTDADLQRAKLSSSSTPTNLRFAHLERADFTNASLRNANLYHAVLEGAKFDGADLSGANMTAAKPTFEQLSKAAWLDDETRVDDPLSITSCKNLDGSLSVSLHGPDGDSVDWAVPPPHEDDSKAARLNWEKRLKSTKKCP